MGSAVDCPDDNTLAALFDRSIGTATLEALDGHFDECERCRTVVALALGSNKVANGTPSALVEIDRDPEGLFGSTIDDRYQVTSLLGRGGMGTDYLARDITLDRDIALKIHRPGTGDARLKREAIAMAQLAHPNVVNVFEVGTIRGAAYVAMEYVRGATLRDWVRATKRPWRDIIAVLIDTGRGLGAAHAAGIVHRDFKPENVLVGEDDRPRVSDFGLARVGEPITGTASASASIETTMAGTLVGTPAYMAPEQFAATEVDRSAPPFGGADGRARPPVDARSDQFAFCVVAWECLFDQRPFAGTTIAEVRGAVERHELRAVRSAVPDRVRRVLERGLAAASTDRYADMPALLAALDRAASPRFKRRATVAITALVLASGATWARGRSETDTVCPPPSIGASWELPQRTHVEAAFLATGLPYAQLAWTRTAQSLDRFADRWRAQGRDACLAFEVHHTDDAALHARRTTCLEQGKLAFDAVIDRLGDHGSTSRAIPKLVAMLPEIDACVRPDNFQLPVEPASRATYVAFLTDVASIQSLILAGRIDAAAHALDPATRAAQDLGSKRATAMIAFLTGQVAELQRRNADAVKAFESALWTAEATGYDELVAASASEVLHTLGGDARDADAQRFRELARSAADRIGTVTARARAARAIGQADLVAGRYDSAEQELTNALALVRSQVPVDDYDVGTVITDLGDLYYRRGQAAKAEPFQRQAVEAFTRAVGPDHPALGTAYDNLANTLADLGRYDEAGVAYGKALSIRERTLGLEHPEVAMTLSNAAGVAVQAGKLDEGRRELERALAIDDKTLPPLHPSIAHVLFNLGEVARLQGAFADAVRFHTRALDARRKTLGDHHPMVAESYLALAEDAFAQHDLVAAASSCRLARTTIAGSDAKNAELLGNVDACDGNVALETGHPTAAVPLFEHALELHRQSEGDPGELAAIQFALARSLPASAAPRALELVRAARTAFEHEGAFRRREVALADAWLHAHPK